MLKCSRIPSSIMISLCLWKVSKHDSSDLRVVEVWDCSRDKYMKSTRERMTGITQLGTPPMLIPMKTFSISLCSVPVHCDTDDIPLFEVTKIWVSIHSLKTLV